MSLPARASGLSAKDRRVWRSFVAFYPGIELRAAFNVRVGHGRAEELYAPEIANLPGAQDWQKRVDVVVRAGAVELVIELKPVVTAAAAGQCALYAALRASEVGKQRVCLPLVVGNTVDEDYARYPKAVTVAWLALETGRWMSSYGDVVLDGILRCAGAAAREVPGAEGLERGDGLRPDPGSERL